MYDWREGERAQRLRVDKEYTLENTKIRDITIGFLYRKSFGVMDRWGGLADEILRSATYFSSSYFPSIQTNQGQQGRLYNPEKGHYLVVSADNMIYCHVFQDDFDKEYGRFGAAIEKDLIPKVINKNDLEVVRIGVVYTYILTEDQISKYSSSLFKPEMKGINDFRFSRKEPSVKGGSLDGTDDYINKIITVGAVPDDKLGITYDYQYIFEPPKKDVSKDVKKIISNAKKSFNSYIDQEVLSVKRG